MKNIAFYSPGPQHGKTTASRFLARRFGYQQISFADPIKAMLAVKRCSVVRLVTPIE